MKGIFFEIVVKKYYIIYFVEDIILYMYARFF